MVAPRLPELFVGLDLGATNCKAIALTTDGTVVAAARRPMPPLARSGRPVRVESDPIAILSAAFETIKDVVDAAAGSPIGIGISSQMHGVVVVDDALQPETPFISWQDCRALESVPGSDRSFIEVLRAVLAPSQERAGCNLRPGALGPLAYWFASQPLPPRGTLMFLGDFVVSHLTGARAGVAPSQAAGSCVYDIASKSWLDEFVEVLPSCATVLPSLLEAAAVSGTVSSASRRILGLPAGVPVVSSVGDHQAALIGAGIEVGDLSINVGTGAQVSLLQKEGVTHLSAGTPVEVRPFRHGLQLLCRPGLPGGRELDVLVSFLDTLTEGVTETGQWHKRLESEAAELAPPCVPGATSGFGTGVGGGFDGLTRETFSAAGLYRGVINAMSDAYREAYDDLVAAVDRENEAPRRILLSGGVCRRSALLREETDARLSVSVALGPYGEEAAAGAALHARDVLYA